MDRNDRWLRAAVVIDAAAGALTAVMRIWARCADDEDLGAADLAALMERAYDALIDEAAAAASARTRE
ncbi:hypothetical protein [Streptomyces sp. NRRL S-1824]|uniref:hypothetical protein n=1 Tax=Streptomyces sp. NRRL S-1824 TaxID=1463889 RepID=UPI0004C5788F|nr:hypothetical protein [Streptomyces sp. NRRL S-1824]